MDHFFLGRLRILWECWCNRMLCRKLELVFFFVIWPLFSERFCPYGETLCWKLPLSINNKNPMMHSDVQAL